MRISYLIYKNMEVIISAALMLGLGSLLHFAYKLSGKNLIVGLICPVNESIWEHMKLAVVPVILWWTGYFYINGIKNENAWFTGALISLIAAVILVPMLYYFYTGALGKESLIIDIGILFIALIIGQALGLKYYQNNEGIDAFFVKIIFGFIIFIFAFFTLSTPRLPIFKDSVTGTYGMNK